MEVAVRRDRRSELRDRIIEATVRVVRDHGMTRTRTSAIARAAGCAEGTIYRHFSCKAELLLEVVRSRLSPATELMGRLPERAGTGSVRKNLLEVARLAHASYGEVVPLAAGVFADAELLAQQRRLFTAGDLGLVRATEGLAAYLRAEQELGRVSAGVDAAVAAQLFVIGCLGEGVRGALLDRGWSERQHEEYAGALVDAMRGAEP